MFHKILFLLFSIFFQKHLTEEKVSVEIQHFWNLFSKIFIFIAADNIPSIERLVFFEEHWFQDAQCN